MHSGAECSRKVLGKQDRLCACQAGAPHLCTVHPAVPSHHGSTGLTRPWFVGADARRRAPHVPRALPEWMAGRMAARPMGAVRCGLIEEARSTL